MVLVEKYLQRSGKKEIAKCKGCGVQMQGLVAQLRNHKIVGKCNILKDVQDEHSFLSRHYKKYQPG